MRFSIRAGIRRCVCIKLADGSAACGDVTFGASTGQFEAHELRDDEKGGTRRSRLPPEWIEGQWQTAIVLRRRHSILPRVPSIDFSRLPDRAGANPITSDPTWLDLYDWRERVADMYRDRDARHRTGEDPEAVLTRFRAAKDALFAGHQQSPLGSVSRTTFKGLHYFGYDPRWRVSAKLSLDEPGGAVDAPSSMPETMPLRREAKVEFSVGGDAMSLTVFWIDVYGGSLFLPFRDATCPAESYGAGRYLFDTVKGSGFETGTPHPDTATGYAGGEVVLDFNYAYNPSCAYDPRWACPLAPRENWLPEAIRAGERKFEG